MKAHPALFEREGEGDEPITEALLSQSTVDIYTIVNKNRNIIILNKG